MNEPENYLIEDQFIVNQDGWIDLPGNEGKVSPDGIVYDNNGEPMYSLYEDNEAPLNVYIDDVEEYDWLS